MVEHLERIDRHDERESKRCKGMLRKHNLDGMFSVAARREGDEKMCHAFKPERERE